MKFYGKAESVGNKLLAAFENGTVPEALGLVFIHRLDDVPSNSWSWNNKALRAMACTNDGRGFKAWKKVGRRVKKGTSAFYILAPSIIKKKDEKTDEETTALIGYRSVAVFAKQDTEVFDEELWSKHSELDQEAEQFLDSLPLVDVARNWGLDVGSFNGENSRCRGFYLPGQQIQLGTQNLSTWAHELVHAADDKNGTLGRSDRAESEIVAEFGGAIILQCLGMPVDSDLGGAWRYIQSCASGNKSKALGMAMRLLKRTCECVDLIMSTADELQAASMQEVA